MKRITRHFTRCFIAGLVAILPIGGVILATAYFEKLLSESWLKDQGFYFFGMGILVAVASLYAVGLLISTFLGRWLWRLIDKVLSRLPLLGRMYQTLKQVLGYGEGEDAVFRRVVLVPCRDLPGHEFGLVTQEPPAPEPLVVFIPGAPNPSAGRVLLIDPADTTPLDVPVTEVLKCLVSIGALPLDDNAAVEEAQHPGGARSDQNQQGHGTS